MGESNVVSISDLEATQDCLTELVRTGARRLIEQAVEAELQELMAEYQERRLPDGRAGVVRNGYQPERAIQTGIGPVTVRIPKVRAKTGDPVTFRSAIVPPYVRKTRSLEAALPWLYLKGISTGEMAGALEVLVGKEARGLSASTIARLKRVWAEEYKAWTKERLDKDRWVYCWADGIYSGLRSEDTKLCALVIIGVNERGKKRFLAIEDGVRESTQSWREVLLGMKQRGMSPPKLAVGDGAMGFWAALDEVFPETRHQRCWVHKTANVLNGLPKSSQAKAKEGLQEIYRSASRKEAETAFDEFIEIWDAKYPKSTARLIKDREELLAFYEFPAEHWQSLRTSNPIESTFGTIRHRTKRSKGCLTRDGMLHMMYKLARSAEGSWRRLNGFDHLAKVIEGVKFNDGKEVKNSHQDAA